MRIARLLVLVIVTVRMPLLASPRTPAPARAVTLVVRVNLQFDPSITSNTIKTLARGEAAAIWRPYGVDLVWTDPLARADLTLDVIVERFPQRTGDDGSPSVLGSTTVTPNPGAQAPIRISFDAVDSLIGRRHGADPLRHFRELGLAVGRVLAHEVGHVLLGSPAYHDPAGLMRTTFLSDDLVGPERSPFLLMPRSVARLRVRIASLSGTRIPESARTQSAETEAGVVF